MNAASQARQVRMGTDPYASLLKILENSPPLTRGQVYALLSDDFADEADCAKALGRMVADGRLHRSGSSGNFLYSARPSDALDSRIETIAKAAVKVHEPIATNGGGIQTEDAMPRTKAAGKTREKFIELMNPERGWISPAAAAKSCGTTPSTASYHLNALAAQGALQVRGYAQARRFAALGVAVAPCEEQRPEEGGSAEPSRKKKTGARAARAPRSAPPRNLANFGAPEKAPIATLPVATGTGVTENPRCAIEDTGLFAINDGANTIRLGRKGIAKVIDFLTLTQHVWKGAA